MKKNKIIWVLLLNIVVIAIIGMIHELDIIDAHELIVGILVGYGLLNVYLTKVILEKQDKNHQDNLRENIRQQYHSTLKTLAKIIDAKDHYTGEHSQKVLEYTDLILKSLNIDKEEKENIRFAASLHDIGKIGISDSILNKPSSLTIEEFEEMKSHSQIGASILEEHSELKEVAKIILYHHERWDGTGYPYGIKEEEIPLGSRIIAIADSFDAMTSDRVYRNALSKQRAMQILKEEKGRQFSADLVEIFLHKIDNLYYLETTKSHRFEPNLESKLTKDLLEQSI